MKTCVNCGESKPLEDFYIQKTNKDGRQGRCKTCASDLQRARKRERRLKINAIKTKKGCVDCGYNKDPVALDFDHLDNKEFGIGDNISRTWHSIEKEIAKCEVVCANCHRIRTARRANWVQSDG